MTNKRSVSSLQLGVLGACLLSLSAVAQIRIYDNSVNDLVLRYTPPTTGTPGTLAEVGNQVDVVRATLNNQYLSTFNFEFYGTNTIHPGSFSGSISAQVRFYLNDGSLVSGYNSPSTMFYNSGVFAVSGGPTARSTIWLTEGVDWASGGLYLPSSEFTWTVQFSGLGAGDEVGVDIYGPPVVGNAFDDMWVNNGTPWQLLSYGSGSNVIAARFDSIPEPSTVALLVLGGLGVFIANRRNRIS